MKSIYYLSSFPRSGNTWVRFLIANLFKILENDNIEVDFHNVHDIIPEYKQKKTTINFHYSNMPKVCKTHNKYSETFTKAILLLRNPFDVFESYHDFLINNRGLKLSFNDMVTHDNYGIKKLINHTNSYIENCPELLIINYEKLKKNTVLELDKICSFVKLKASKKQLIQAVNASLFDNMKKIEKKKGRKFGNPDFEFIRKGESGLNEEQISKDKKIYDYMKLLLKNCEILREIYL